MLLLARALILRGDVDDSVRVDVEGDLNLRNSARCRGNAVQIEVAERTVLARHLALALQDVNRDGSLTVGGGGEHLALLGRNRRVAVDQAGEHATHRLNSERKRRNVQKDHVLDITLEDSALDGGTDGDRLVGVDRTAAFLAEDALDDFLNLGHAGRTADEQDFVNLVAADASIGHSLAAGLFCRLKKVVGHLLELGASQGLLQVLRAGRVSRDERQVNLSRRLVGKRNLRVLGGLAEALLCHRVLGQVNSRVGLEAVDQPADDAAVPVVSSQVGISIRGLNLKYAVTQLKD